MVSVPNGVQEARKVITMEKMIKQVSRVISEEYHRSSATFGATNASDHESYAITLEELQEALENSHLCSMDLEEFWRLTKDKKGSDEDKLSSLDSLWTNAMLAACEYIQVAAMAYKAERTIRERSDE